MSRTLAGDREATRRLFAHVLCPVIERRVAHRIARAGSDRAALHDHVQEVMVHLLERDAEVLRRWDPQRGPLEPYIARVAENLIISRLRRRPQPSPSDELDREADTANRTPEEDAGFARLVMRLMNEISDDDAVLFRAVYLEEMSADEAATLLHITRDAVHKRIQRLRARLSHMLSDSKGSAT